MVVTFNRNQAASAFEVFKAQDAGAQQRPKPEVSAGAINNVQLPQQHGGSNARKASHNQQQRKTHVRRYIAQRFKTMLCEKFQAAGSCPYGNRCMFAHGSQELRTAEMNLRDRITTLEAIESFRRAATARNRGELADFYSTTPTEYQQEHRAAPAPGAVPARQPAPPAFSDWGIGHQPTSCTCPECTGVPASPTHESSFAPVYSDQYPPVVGGPHDHQMYSHNPYGFAMIHQGY